jgi:hypothetical protein
MKKFVFLLIIFLTSCAPSVSAVATAIAQTQAAAVQTQAAAETETPTETPTNTPTVTPTVTPTPDIRVIRGDPYDYLLKQIDLPKEGKYFLPNETWLGGSPNEQRIAERGIEKGKDYVVSTGRIFGWWIDYLRGTIAAPLPEEIYCDIGFFETAAGALLAETKYNYPTILSPEANWEIKDLPINIGDYTVVAEIVDNNINRVWREIIFTYRNVSVLVLGYGMESDVQWEFVQSLAEMELAKLQAAPLTLP